jgi:hypothetical protein
MPYPPLSVIICVGFLWEDVSNSTELCDLCQLYAFFPPDGCKRGLQRAALAVEGQDEGHRVAPKTTII